MKTLIKKLARFILGDYGFYYVVSITPESFISEANHLPDYIFTEVEKSQIEKSDDPLIRQQKFYCGSESFSFACLKENRILGVAFCWYGKRYQKLDFWPISVGELMFVQYVVSPSVRQLGIGNALHEYALKQVFQSGFHRVYGRVWHNNMPSIKILNKAGWRRVGILIEINPFRREKPIRIRYRL